MTIVDEILDSQISFQQKVEKLKQGKLDEVRKWEEVKKELFPKYHDVNNKSKRRDKVAKNKTEEVSRIGLDLQALAVKRMTEFMFAIPVKRIYKTNGDSVLQEIAKTIEKIYTKNHIDSENIKRARKYFGTCEIATLWYTEEKENNLYGIKSGKKIRCKTYSPITGHYLYPYFNEFGDMVAFSVQYSVKKLNRREDYFDTYTDDRHIVFKLNGRDAGVVVDEKNNFGKIPYIYTCRQNPIWENLTPLINEIEMTLSRNSDVIAYNSAPILVANGMLSGSEEKGESRRLFQVEKGGSVNYVSWSQSTESVKYHIDTLLRLFWLQLQLPDISLENLRGMIASGEAMKTLLADAHLKCGDESGEFYEFFERESNVIKEIVRQLNPSWSAKIDELEIEHVITPFVQNDEKNEIQKWSLACGGKPLMSRVEAIKNLGISEDAEQTYKDILEEEQQEQQTRIEGLMEGGI